MYTYTYVPKTKAPNTIDDIQLKIAELELLRAKLEVYHVATELNPDGTRAMSEQKAKCEILGMTDAQIKDELDAQFFESKMRSEIKQAPELLGTYSVFDGLIYELTDGVKTTKVEKDAEMLALSATVHQLEEDITIVYQEMTNHLKENSKTIRALEVTVQLLKELVLNPKK